MLDSGEAATVQPITTHLMQKRLRWYGYVRRIYDSHMTRRVFDVEVEGVRPRGRPTLRYMDTIRRDMKRNRLRDVNILDFKTGEWQHPGRPNDVKSLQSEKVRNIATDANYSKTRQKKKTGYAGCSIDGIDQTTRRNSRSDDIIMLTMDISGYTAKGQRDILLCRKMPHCKNDTLRQTKPRSIKCRTKDMDQELHKLTI